MKIWLLNDYNVKKYIYFNSIIEEFKKEKSINIDIEIKSRENIWSLLFDFLNNPDAKIADIIEIPHQWTSVMAKLGLTLNVDFVIDLENKKIFDFLKDTMKYENTSKFFSIPIFFETMAFFYRKDMIEKVVSKDDINKLKWNDLFLLCDRLKKIYKSKNYYPLENTNPSGYVSCDDILCAVMNRTDGYFSDIFSVDLHKEEVIVSIIEFISLCEKKYMPLFEENFFELGFFKKGLSSLAFSFRRDLLEIDNVSVARFPDIMRNNELIRSNNFIFFSGTSEIDEIKKFMEYFYTPTILTSLAKSINVFSPFKIDAEKYMAKREADFYLGLFDRAKPIINTTVYPTFEKMMNDTLRNFCIKIISNSYQSEELKQSLLEIKAVTEYLITSY